MQGGDDWLNADIGPPVTFHDEATGHPIQRLGIRNAGGVDLPPDQIAIRAGPGAAAKTRTRAGG